MSKGNIQTYLNKHKEWQVRAKVKKSKQALIVWLSLPNEDSTHIKRLLLNYISIADLTKDDAMAKLFEALKEVGRYFKEATKEERNKVPIAKLAKGRMLENKGENKVCREEKNRNKDSGGVGEAKIASGQRRG